MPFRALPLINSNNHKKSRKQLLLVRLDGIGDFVLFLDTFKEYRRLYPSHDWQITLLGNRLWRTLAENLAYADRYWFIDTKRFLQNPLYRYRILLQIRNANFDLVIQPTCSRNYWLGDAVVRASGAPKRIGSDSVLANTTLYRKCRSDRWFTDLIPVSSDKMMELEQNANFIRNLGLTDFRAGLPELPVSDVAERRVEVILGESGLQRAPFYILFPGAGVKHRRWPVENFASLAQRIYDYSGWTGMICAGPGEEALAKELVTFAPGIPLIDLSGRINLIEFAGIIDQAKFLVGNETGSIHMAASVGTPAVCILGGGHYGRFLPYQIAKRTTRPLPVAVSCRMDCFGCNWKCVYAEEVKDAVPCVANVSVLQVWGAVEKLLEVPSLIKS